MTVTSLPDRRNGQRAAAGGGNPRLKGAPDRWSPTRAGLLNVWQYADETFQFEKGRLVLYGQNGSGKTMALELLFPYLLDANAAPYRLSTAGGNERGGLWSRVSGYDDTASGRVGYLWAEFGRTHADGRREYFTCGTRLEPRAGNKGGVQCWFTTTLRVGYDFTLYGRDRVPLTAKELREAIEGHGTVWAEDTVGYRNAVRAALYADFRPDQYLAMIDGLLAVRKQSITDGLTPDKLHALLSDGLPALDANELDQVARGFEQLDNRRDTIAALEQAVAAGKALERRVRTYSRSVMRVAAGAVASAFNDFDDVTRDRRDAQRTLAEAAEKASAAAAGVARLTGELNALEARRRGIEASEAYSSIDQLEARRAAAEQAEAISAERADFAAAQRNRAEAERRRSESAAADAAAAAEQLAQALRAVRDAAHAAGVEFDADADPAQIAAGVQSAVRAAEIGVREVRAAIAARDKRALAVAHRSEDVDRADRHVEDRSGKLADAEVSLQAALDRWADAVSVWADRLTELPLGRDELAAAVAAGDLGAVAAARDRASRDAHVALAGEDRQLAQAEHRVGVELGELRAERERLEREDVLLEPPVAPWRRPRGADRAGAALWALLAPSPETDPSDLDGLEAALSAAGLLDAWVYPDGLDAATVDVGDIRTAHAPAADRVPLGAYLTVDEAATKKAGVDAAVVRDVLAAVTVEPSAAAMPELSGGLVLGVDGTFRAGPAYGRAPVAPAQHIGAAARERTRLARITELDELIAAAQQQLDELATKRQAVQARIEAADREARRLPDGRDVVTARNELDMARDRLEEAEQRAAEARDRLGRAEAAVARARQELDRVAGTLGLPTSAEDLDALTQRLRDAERAAIGLPGVAALARERAAQAAVAAAAVEAAETAAAEATESAKAALRRAEAARTEYDNLERHVGADARAAAADMAAVSRRISEATEELEQLRAKLESARVAQARAEEKLDGLTERQEAASRQRELLAERFRALIDAGVAADAQLLTGVETVSLTSVKNAAQQVKQVISAEPALQVLQRELSQMHDERHKATTVLAGRADVSIDDVAQPDGDPAPLPVVRATALVGGVTVSIAEMVARFERELSHAKAELAESETRLFEETLTGSLRAHLASRLRSAQGLVDSMNALLSGIRTAAGGVAVSLRWELADDVDDRETLATVKQLLLRDHHTPADRDVLFKFLSRRIDLVRHADRATTSWRDALESLFDYRDWHRFRIMVRHDRFGEKPVVFTSRKVSLSTGEKALVLSLPLFAAVASHYMPRDENGAPRTCPRLLLLDEVFPKNDRENKRQILRLLTDLDLDCVLTSDKDMCDYDTIDGIAIAVIHKDGDGSFSTRMTWNGTELCDAPVDVAGTGVQGALL